MPRSAGPPTSPASASLRLRHGALASVAGSRSRSIASSASRRLTLGVEPRQHAHLVLAREPVERVRHRRPGRVRNSESWSAISSPPPAASKPSRNSARFAIRSPGARALELGSEREEARHARAHELREREQVRAAERAAEDRAEAPHEAGVEPLADQRLEPRRGIAARVAARERRRLEGHRRLRGRRAARCARSRCPPRARAACGG